MKICIFERSNEKNHFSRTKIIFYKKLHYNYYWATKNESRSENEFWETYHNIPNLFDGCWHPLLTLNLRSYEALLPRILKVTDCVCFCFPTAQHKGDVRNAATSSMKFLWYRCGGSPFYQWYKWKWLIPQHNNNNNNKDFYSAIPHAHGDLQLRPKILWIKTSNHNETQIYKNTS